ncbi:acyl-CoA dehydrogenase family protein [Paractinoplanes hotanensis]|uniref:Acyl-CoA dehydrogenase family protein n=1 Tax=Paractinoplanes hotanensis TaxID=2906497 RepID=A0ABT0Y5Y0_9ACTN|nr:acyl-CoA dehydrogenase family protein [Actinoplanes hotanensis]MCM4081434.1 acyl-CoA dehydrogenase family protein [Actinoplanes hotanensis]
MAAPALPLAATAARHFEELLGDPADAGVVFNHARVAAADETETFPVEIWAELDRLGLPAHYVPAAYGGELRGFDTLVQVLRAVARRDLTTAVGHAKTFLGCASVWARAPRGEADTAQALRLAGTVLAGTPVCWALTEPDHGSDLMGGEVTAVRHAAGYRLNGTKWLINNATRAGVVCVLARTDPDGGPRGFTVLLADKRDLPVDTYRCLPRESTHGIRGADISGISFLDAPVPATELVGAPGSGLETVLRALQLTRTACTALSLGAADHALALVRQYLAERRLYGRRLADVPVLRRAVGRLHAMHFLAEAVTAVATRAVTVETEQMSVLAPVVKAFVPTLTDQLLQGCGEQLGARAFLTGIPGYGRFQKIERDHRIVGIFDGSTPVNRNAVINQFPQLARAWSGAPADVSRLRPLARLDLPVPELDPGRLTLAGRGGCLPLLGLAAAVAAVDAAGGPVTPARALLDATGRIHAELAAHRPAAHDVEPAAYDLARRFELCVAGAAAVHLWLHNHDRAGADPLWEDGLWLEAALTFVLHQLGAGPAGATVYDRVFAALPGDRRPSVLDLDLAEEA